MDDAIIKVEVWLIKELYKTPEDKYYWRVYSEESKPDRYRQSELFDNVNRSSSSLKYGPYKLVTTKDKIVELEECPTCGVGSWARSHCTCCNGIICNDCGTIFDYVKRYNPEPELKEDL